jgi:hypothetical protein
MNKQRRHSKVGDRVRALDITNKERYREGVIIAMTKTTVDILMLDNGLKNTYTWKKIKD